MEISGRKLPFLLGLRELSNPIFPIPGRERSKFQKRKASCTRNC